MVRRDWILASYPSGRMGPRDFSRSDRPWRSDGMSQTGRTVGRRERPFRVNRDDRDFGGLGGTWGIARAVLDWSSHRHPRRTRRRTPDPPHSWGGDHLYCEGYRPDCLRGGAYDVFQIFRWGQPPFWR